MSTQKEMAARARSALSKRFPHLAALAKANAPKPPVRSKIRPRREIAASRSSRDPEVSRFAHLRPVAAAFAPSVLEVKKTRESEAREQASRILAAARAAGLKL